MLTTVIEYAVLADGVHLSFGTGLPALGKAQSWLAEEIQARKERAAQHPETRKFQIMAENSPYLVCRTVILAEWSADIKTEPELSSE